VIAVKRYDLYDKSGRRMGSARESRGAWLLPAVAAVVAIGFSLPFLLGLVLPSLVRLVGGWLAVFALWWAAAAALTGQLNPSAAQQAITEGKGGPLRHVLTAAGLIGLFAVLIWGLS
jgi:hypothetical protein